MVTPNQATQNPVDRRDDALMETQLAYQQEYEAAGVTPMIAETAAAARTRQDAGDPLDQIDQEVLGFAEGIRRQQEQLATLPQYQARLETAGFDAAAAEYEADIPEIGDLTTPDAVEERQVAIAADLTQRGVAPNTAADIQERVGVFLTTATAVGDDNQPPVRTGLSDDALGADATSPELENELQMLTDAQILMQTAREAGIATQDGDTALLQGDNYRITQQGDTTVIEGDGKKLIADGNEVLKAEGFGEEDFERFARLGQRSADDLKQSVAQGRSPAIKNEQARTQRQRQITVQRTKGMQL